ncbi:MAG: response regulator transcription factor [Streptosporangiaceae bacterium]|nr:response regulator transcription factor [Streptosporangiaceae bacterium]
MSSGRKRRGQKRPLQDLVPEDVAAGHEKLFAAGGIPKDQAEGFLGADIAGALADLGLAHVVPHTRTAPASFQAVRPDLALLVLLASFQAQAGKDHELIMSCVERLREMLAGPVTRCTDDPRQLVRVLTDKDEILTLSIDLIYSAHKDWMTLENTDTDMPITEDFGVRIPPALRGKVCCRGIYDLASVEHPVMARNIERAVAEGEIARVVPKVPMKMKLADQAVALLPFTPTASGGAVLIRGCGIPILAGLKEYYDLKWATGTQTGSRQPPPGCPLTSAEAKVLQLMAQGLTNAAITRRLGISDSTVGRHIDTIMKALDAPGKSKFAAGVIAHQRGWLPDLEAR